MVISVLFVSSSTNDETSCGGMPVALSSGKPRVASGASKRRKRKEASKNVQKLSTYFRPIEQALQSQTKVETLRCTECDTSRSKSELHGSTTACDHNVFGGFEGQSDLICEATIEDVTSGSVFSSSITKLSSDVELAILSSHSHMNEVLRNYADDEDCF